MNATQTDTYGGTGRTGGGSNLQRNNPKNTRRGNGPQSELMSQPNNPGGVTVTISNKAQNNQKKGGKNAKGAQPES
jgi:hypothetical protein